ncbi:MAG TPA: hypothetical protein VFC92_08010 [Bacteroidales bacterium]|nr:hypothetical protein [Bacteroidales bacterium]
MKKRFTSLLPFAIITLAGMVIVASFYGKVLSNPNDVIFSDSGDGIKNYFTYAYHIRHDSTYTNFEGMNYPYGENYLYTDCHPIVSNAFKFLSVKAPFFISHSVGLLNILMILSILFTFVITYLLLVELKVNKWMSVFFSISITLLAPQIFRLGGHLALSYSVAIPLSWLITLKVIKNTRKIYLILLFISNIFWMFIHAYLGVIVISFLFSIALLQILSDKQRREKLINYILLALAIVLPVILFYSYAALTDTHAGRTNNPSGFFLYNAEFDDILIPHHKPFGPLLNKLTGEIISLQWEAWGYVGLFNSLLFIAVVITLLLSFFNTNARALLKTIFDNRRLNISLFASFIVLLFAMGIPFKQFPKLLELLPILKQFRATGRFVWPFYFAFTAFAAYAFQTKVLNHKDKKKRTFGILFIVLLLGTSYVEGFYYHIDVAKSITKTPNLFNEDLLTQEFTKSIARINPDDYQAIISIPFYYQGSESYARPRNDEAIRNSLALSYHTGIPNVCANLTRTSVEESKKIVQIVTPNYYSKKITDNLPNKKPFLIVKTGNSFTQYEQMILEKGRSISKNDKFELLQIEFDDLFSDDRNKVINDFQEKLSDLAQQDEFYVTRPGSVLYFNNFENISSDTSFRGQGSFTSIKKGKNVFAEFPPNTFQKDKEYEFSMWMFNGEPDALNMWFRVIVEEFDEINNTWYTTTFFPDQAEVINNNWSLAEGVFTVKYPKNRVYIVSKGKEDATASLHVDDLLIKERGVDVYKIDSLDNSLFFNNHRVSLR